MNNEELMKKFCSTICDGYQRCFLKPELVDTCDILAYLQEIYKAGRQEAVEFCEKNHILLLDHDYRVIGGKHREDCRLCKWQAFKRKLGLEPAEQEQIEKLAEGDSEPFSTPCLSHPVEEVKKCPACGEDVRNSPGENCSPLSHFAG